jgi:formate hydrogenlyase subunit 4
MLIILTILQTLIFIVFAPLLTGLVKAIKCKLQNRKGPPIFQPYRDLMKLFHKEMCIADTSSFIFHITPYVVFSTTIAATMVIPLLVCQPGFAIADVIVLVGLFALSRFFLALAGMDIGTAFGGMGSSREMLIAAIAEPALLMAFFTLAMIASSTNLMTIVQYFSAQYPQAIPSLLFAACGFALVAIAETGRIPVDNPATHLELTMIHEAMILEYSGRYLALVEWAAQIKFMIYCVLFINLFFPWGIAQNLSLSAFFISFFVLVCKLIIICIALTVAEINLAKLRLFRVPYLLNIAFLLCLLGMLSHIILEVG